MAAQISLASGETMSLLDFMSTKEKVDHSSDQDKTYERWYRLDRKVAPRPTMSAGYVTYAFLYQFQRKLQWQSQRFSQKVIISGSLVLFQTLFAPDS